MARVRLLEAPGGEVERVCDENGVGDAGRAHETEERLAVFVEVGEPVAHERALIASRVAVREEPRVRLRAPHAREREPGRRLDFRAVKGVRHERDASTRGRAAPNLPG